MSIVMKWVATLIAIVLYGWINFLLNPVGTVVSGQLAGKQFEDSDSSYVLTMWGLRFFSDFGLPLVLLVIAIVVIWWKQVKSVWGLLFPVMLVGVVAILQPKPAEAYYDTINYTEGLLHLAERVRVLHT